jgi:hypothetical protein
MRVAGIPLMTICGAIGAVFTFFVAYRIAVDPNFAVMTPVTIAATAATPIIGLIWFYVARAIRMGQGVNVDRRFEQIPIE